MIERTHRTEIRRGFTLLEMLAVVAIIVLLAAIAVPMVMGRLEDARKDKARVDCKTLVQQTKMYKMKYGDYPLNLEALTQPGADGSSPYIEARFLIDPWNRQYQYQAPGQHSTVGDPDVWSMGPPDKPIQIGSWER